MGLGLGLQWGISVDVPLVGVAKPLNTLLTAQKVSTFFQIYFDIESSFGRIESIQD